LLLTYSPYSLCTSLILALPSLPPHYSQLFPLFPLFPLLFPSSPIPSSLSSFPIPSLLSASG
jgi:hypothetical protein